MSPARPDPTAARKRSSTIWCVWKRARPRDCNSAKSIERR